MKRILFFLVIFLFTELSSAQVVQSIYPQGSSNGKREWRISSGGNQKLTFDFGGGKHRSYYNGFCEVVMKVDTNTAGAVGNRNAMTVSIYPLFFSPTTGNLEESAAADKDSITIKSSYDWGSTHSDSKIAFNVSANLPPCDGARLNTYVGANGQVDINPSLRIFRDK